MDSFDVGHYKLSNLLVSHFCRAVRGILCDAHTESKVVVLLCCDLGNNGHMGITIAQLMEIPKISLVEHIHC